MASDDEVHVVARVADGRRRHFRQAAVLLDLLLDNEDERGKGRIGAVGKFPAGDILGHGGPRVADDGVAAALFPDDVGGCLRGQAELHDAALGQSAVERVRGRYRADQILWGATGGWDLTLAACSRAGDGSEEKNDGLFPSRHARR